MNESLVILLILIVIDIPLFTIIAKLMFDGWGGFWDNFKWNLMPDIISLLTGRYLKDKRGELKSGMYLTICFVILFLEFLFVQNFFLN